MKFSIGKNLVEICHHLRLGQRRQLQRWRRTSGQCLGTSFSVKRRPIIGVMKREMTSPTFARLGSSLDFRFSWWQQSANGKGEPQLLNRCR